MFTLVAVVLVTLLIYLKFFLKTSIPSYWRKNGFKIIDASKAASNFEILLGSKSIMHRDDYVYKALGSGKFCGMMETVHPVILVKDLELIKKITIKDFEHFVDRRDFITIVSDKLAMGKMVGLIHGPQWKGVRSTVSPTFSSGKIRKIMEHFNRVGMEWVEMLKLKTSENKPNGVTVNVASVVNQFIIDIIGTVVFGVNTGAVNDPNAAFARMAHRFSAVGLAEFVKLNLSERFPAIFKLLGIEVMDRVSIEFFENIIRQALDARKKGNFKRNDYLQLLIDAQEGQPKSGNASFTDDLVVAQSFAFLFAGFATMTTFISFALYVLAAEQEIQQKLESEVDSIVKDDGTFDFDEVSALPFMEMFLNEVLRHFPGATRLERICTKEYRDPESGLFVPKNGVVVIPLNAIQKDPNYFPNPERFDPENFSEENKARRSPYTFMPFGMGPRNCVGLRFAMIESKTAIAHLIHRFRVEPTAKTPLPVQGISFGKQWITPKDLELKLIPRF